MTPLVGLVCACLGFVAADDAALETIGRLKHEPIREASGIVASRKHAGVFWVINDSGNPPVLFAVKRDGTLVREYKVAAINLDWEAIAIDDAGFIYIGDIGNNDARLPIRVVYKLAEPDPSGPAPAAPLPLVAASHYRFAETGRFDAEALFVDAEKRVVMISKTPDGRESELFRIEFNPPATLFRPVDPIRVGSLPDFVEPVTGADITANGRRLAVCSYGVLRVYEPASFTSPRWRKVGELRFKAQGVEGICWDGDDLLLCAESREMYRVKPAQWRRNEK